MVTEKDVNWALETRFDGLGRFLIAQECLELEEKHLELEEKHKELQAENNRLQETLASRELLADVVRKNQNEIYIENLCAENERLQEALEKIKQGIKDDISGDAFCVSITGILEVIEQVLSGKRKE